MMHRRVLLAAGLSLALAAACHQDELFTPLVPAYAGGALFQRYVSMGNSITMGIQSGGIDDSSQRAAYPVLVAAVMGGDHFYYPSLAEPGCPPRYTNIFTGARVGGGTSPTCAFRSAGIPPYISNVAIQGAWAIDLFANGPAPGTHSNPLTQLALGGRTQLQAMMAAQPTFVSVWIGNNDLIQAAFANEDRKSTRLNSSHGYISYAVFCLKKKKTTTDAPPAAHALCAADPRHRRARGALPWARREIGRAHICTPVTLKARIPCSACTKNTW